MTRDEGGGGRLPERMVRQWLESIGERIGEVVFDMLCHLKNSPTIQKQKRHYSETIGRTFVMYVFTVLIAPVATHLSQLGEGPPPATVDDPFLYDLMTSTPSVDYFYAVYGGSIITIASLLLATQLFDNFVVGNMERGKMLALAHAAIVFIFTGNAFQAGAQYENELSPPALDPSTPAGQVAEAQYYFFEHLGMLFPYITILIVSAVIAGAYLFLTVQGDGQTTITSDRWES